MDYKLLPGLLFHFHLKGFIGRNIISKIREMGGEAYSLDIIGKLTKDQRFTHDDLAGDIFIWNGPLENVSGSTPETDLGNYISSYEAFTASYQKSFIHYFDIVFLYSIKRLKNQRR